MFFSYEICDVIFFIFFILIFNLGFLVINIKCKVFVSIWVYYKFVDFIIDKIMFLVFRDFFLGLYLFRYCCYFIFFCCY